MSSSYKTNTEGGEPYYSCADVARLTNKCNSDREYRFLGNAIKGRKRFQLIFSSA
jgi:hypothetical protein